MILIVSAHDDPHAEEVCSILWSRGAQLQWFDHGEFPSTASISVKLADEGVHRFVETDHGAIDLDQVTAIWHRRPSAPEPHPAITDKRYRDYIRQETTSFLTDFWDSFSCLQVPGPRPVYRRAEAKTSQLALARRLGFEIPPTLVTNSPEQLIAFFREQQTEIISKVPSSVLNHYYLGEEHIRFTEVVSRRDLGYAARVRYSPVVFQAYVPKKIELRITVVGERVFTAAIHSQHSRHTRHDWRRYDHLSTPLDPFDLPREQQDLCRRLVQHHGLCYGAIDMVLTPDDRYVFLELNPNGQFLWIEQLTGLPISEAVCDLLMSGARDGRSQPLCAA